MIKRKGFFKTLITLAISLSVIFSFCLLASASEAEVTEGEAVQAEAVEENIFTEIYTAISENAADILSLLSFAASITVALFYKYALSPLIKGGLDKITNGVKDISGESSKEYKSISEAQASLAEQGEELNGKLDGLLQDIDGIKKSARGSLDGRLLTVITAQVNMLNEIFQSSALPVYQKEAVGNMINEMKSELKKDENDNE